MTDFYSLLGESAATTFDLGSKVFGHPDEVLEDPRLSIQQKRSLLASWASDANAVANLPLLRQLPDGSIVKVDDILRALKALDAPDNASIKHESRSLTWLRPFERRRASRFNGWPWKETGSDDDDDPPPCPAVAARRPRDGGGAAFAIPEPAAA